ncbi:MAG: hypothetical protein QOG26_143, partial [Solirubrobacterales bacterium]|nr:hypothetical protein [Solirubrobacterales bacterium]
MGSTRTRLLCIAACLAAGATSVARAADPVPVPSDPTAGTAPSVVDPNPCPTLNQASGQVACDTDHTPIAKDGSAIFAQVAGAHFPNHTAPASSFTPITVDFYAVRFFDQN